MTEQQQPGEPAERATARVLAILAAYEVAQLARPDAEAAMALAVFAGKVTASRLADIAMSTLSSLPPLGIAPGAQHLDRLEAAVSTVLDEPEAAPERLANLTEAEVRTSEQKTTTAAIRGHGYESWREEVAEDACEVCEPFRDRLHPAEDAFESHHPRCRCRAVPVGEPLTVAPETEELPVIRFERGIRRIA